MYCKNEVFNTAVDFTKSTVNWSMFSEPIFGVSVEDRERFIKNIRCSSILMKDAQIENLL